VLRSNIIWLYGMMGLNYLIPAAVLPYLVRVLGAEQYGLIAFAQAVTQYFVIATDYGFNFSATRSIAQSHEDPVEVSRIFWTVTTVKVALLTLGACVLVIIVIGVPRFHSEMAVYFASYLGVIGTAIFPTWLFQGMERMRSISIISGLAKLTSAVMIVLLVHKRSDVVLATLLLSGGFLIAGILGTIVALREHVSGFVLPRRDDIYTSLRDGRHLFLTTAAISLYSNTNTFLVGLLAGNTQAGYFSLADKLIRAITGLVAPVIQASYPQIVRLIAESRERALSFVRKVMRWGAGLGLLTGCGLFLTARSLAALAFGHEGSAVVPLLRWLSLFPLLAAMSYILSTLILIPFGFDRAQSRLLLAIGIINVAIGLAFIPHFGAVGGVIAMSAVELLQIVGASLILARGGVAVLGSAWRTVPID
jgi:polysaccharide transporter, PST family